MRNYKIIAMEHRIVAFCRTIDRVAKKEYWFDEPHCFVVKLVLSLRTLVHRLKGAGVFSHRL